MDSRILTTLARYKFRTTFLQDCVEHITHTSDLQSRQRRVEVKTKWTREKELGSGAFGIVWREREGITKELRAVKIIPKRLLNIREVEALAELQDHPDLFVLFLGWFEDGDYIYLAMEYIEHGDLGQYIKADPTRAKEVAHVIASQILEGLVVLHKRDICHRDMKPQNILIASIAPIWIKISDFGISKRAVGTALRTNCGTMNYKSPEQHALLPRHMRTGNQYTTAVDIWAVGVIIYEVLTSEIPFVDTYHSVNTGFSLPTDDSGPQLDTQMLYGYCHGSDAFPILSLQKSGVGEEGIDFVKSLMAVNPADRATAKDALHRLLSIQALWAVPVSAAVALAPAVAVQATNAIVALVPARVPSVLTREQLTAAQAALSASVREFPVVAPSRAMGPAFLVCELLGLSIPLSPDQANLFGPGDRKVLNRILSSAEQEKNIGFSNITCERITECVDFLIKYINHSRPNEVWSSLEAAARPSFVNLIYVLLDCGANFDPIRYWDVRHTAATLAMALANRGMYEESLQCYGRLLDRIREALGTEHPETLQISHNMSGVFYTQGKFDEALLWGRRALAGREVALGKNHPDTLQTVHNIAGVFRTQAKYDSALECYRRALAGRETALGKDHTDTLKTVHHMSGVLYTQGKYDEALEWYMRAFAGREVALGKNHPDTLKTANHLSRVLFALGKFDEALEWYRRALAGREKTLGKNHPDTLQTVHHMSDVFYVQGKFNEAVNWGRRAFAGREKTLGKDHPDTLDAVYQVAKALHQIGQNDEALEWYRQAFAGRERILGKEHRDSLDSLSGLATVTFGQRKYEEAIEMYGRVFAGRERVLGKDHPDTLMTIHCMAISLDVMDRYDDALEWYARAVAGRVKALGKNHRDTLRTIERMAGMYRRQGKHDEALQCFARVLSGRESVLGKDHPDTKRTAATVVTLTNDFGGLSQSEIRRQSSSTGNSIARPTSRARNKLKKTNPEIGIGSRMMTKFQNILHLGDKLPEG